MAPYHAAVVAMLLADISGPVPAVALPKAPRQLLRREEASSLELQPAEPEECPTVTGRLCVEMCPSVLQAHCRAGKCVCPDGTCFRGGSCKPSGADISEASTTGQAESSASLGASSDSSEASTTAAAETSGSHEASSSQEASASQEASTSHLASTSQEAVTSVEASTSHEVPSDSTDAQGHHTESAKTPAPTPSSSMPDAAVQEKVPEAVETEKQKYADQVQAHKNVSEHVTAEAPGTTAILPDPAAITSNNSTDSNNTTATSESAGPVLSAAAIGAITVAVLLVCGLVFYMYESSGRDSAQQLPPDVVAEGAGEGQGNSDAAVEGQAAAA
eukprot:TRINITY_DN18941_c0_g1_i1.p1 TRINITY_DN18941_c0_g1~~TRINITY_DN18941_c0_g1_i1.p1  ORF type:complete len:353 (-),score=70.52 TRINITY_DN18941_c0_g1_i1:58-1050(-)